MPNIRARKTHCKPISGKPPEEQECIRETKVVIKCENLVKEETFPVLDGEPKNFGQHSHLVEKELLEFTNSLSKAIGSRRKNVLSALIVARDIGTSTFQNLETPNSGPIHACLCELKGRDEGNVVICQKNCCCLIFLETCHCGFELPATPPKIIKTQRNSHNSSRNRHNKIAPKGATDSGRSVCNTSEEPEFRISTVYSSIKSNVKRCFHGSRKNTIGRAESCHEPSKAPLKPQNAKAGPQNETGTSTFCRVVELTERGHLILSRAEKQHKSITKLSKSTRKNHGVQIFLMKQFPEVHMRGANYHQGLQDLLKEIKRTTEWWEHDRSASRLVGKHQKPTKNAQAVHLTGEEDIAPICHGPLNLQQTCVKRNTERVDSPAESFVPRFKAEKNDAKLPIKVQPLDCMQKAKTVAIQKIQQTFMPLSSCEQKFEAEAKAKETSVSTDQNEKPMTAGLHRTHQPPPQSSVSTARQTARPTFPFPEIIDKMKTGQVYKSPLLESGARRAILHNIKLCPENHKELVSKPELADKVKKLHEYFLVEGNRYVFKVWLSSIRPTLVVVCRQEDFCRSYVSFFGYAATLEISHYFPKPSAECGHRLGIAEQSKQLQASPLAESGAPIGTQEACVAAAAKLAELLLCLSHTRIQLGVKGNVIETATQPIHTKTSARPLTTANTDIRAGRVETSVNSSRPGAYAGGTKREPRYDRPVQAKEFRRKPSEWRSPPPRQRVRPPQSSHSSSVSPPKFQQGPNRRVLRGQHIGTRVTPRRPHNSYSVPARNFHPKSFVPAQQFPSRSNFTRSPPIHNVPKNPTTRIHSANPPEFHRRRNFGHYRPFKRRRTDFNERRYEVFHQTYSRQNNFDVSVRHWRNGRIEIDARRCGN